MKIIIKDNIQLTEILQDSKVFDLIYEIANGDDKVYNDITNNLLDNLSDFEGSIKIDYIYKHIYDYLKHHYYPKLNITYDDFYIYIADPEVKRVLLENGFGNSNGVLGTSLLSKTSLPTQAFRNNQVVKSFDELVQFTNIKRLNATEFYRSSIESIDLSNIEYIGGQVFESAPLTNLELDLTKCTYFGWNSFNGCKMKKIHFSENPDLSQMQSFVGCTNLEEITGLSQVTYINNGFGGCSKLKELNLPNLESYGYRLDNLTNCTKIYAPKLKIRTDQSYFFSGNNKLSDLTIDFTSLTIIPERCFWNCKSLTSIDLSNTTTINSAAFDSCNTLISLGDTSNLTTLGAYSFNECNVLTSIDLSNITVIPDRCFWNCKALTSLGDTSNITLIKNYAFRSCTSLTSIDLSSCTSIGQEAFCGCSLLTSVDLSSCISLGHSAFDSCKVLTSVGNTSNLTTLGNYSFNECNVLTSIDLSNVTIIPVRCFWNCKALTSLGDTSNITSIANLAFRSCTSLTSIDLSSCTSIGQDAFCGCTSLTSVNISNVTTILSNAFRSCTSLTSVDLSSCISLGNDSFRECTALISVINSNNLTSIGQYAFCECNKLTSIDLSNVTTIERNTFSNCSSLTSIGSFSSNLTKLGINCFSNTALTGEITIPASVQTLEEGIFWATPTTLIIKFVSETPPTSISNTWLSNQHTAHVIKVPAAAVETYKTAMPFYVNNIVGY